MIIIGLIVVVTLHTNTFLKSTRFHMIHYNRIVNGLPSQYVHCTIDSLLTDHTRAAYVDEYT